MRPASASTIAVVTLSLLALAAVLGGPTAGETDDGEPTLVTVGDVQVWPYVAVDPSFDRRASSLNVVVAADPARVRRYLLREEAWNRSDEEWHDGGYAGNGDEAEGGDDTESGDENKSGDGADGLETNESADAAILDDGAVPWRDAPGGTRYVYVAEEGWVPEQYQLHRGTYFGARYHLRAYAVQDGEWTAIQAHTEHWDWFTITHTVDSVESAQRRVEAGFLGDSGFEVRRVFHGNGDTYDADGWTTVVVVALAPLVALRRLRSRREFTERVRSFVRRLGGLTTGRNGRRFALAGSLAALPLVVRFGGVLTERYLAWLSPNAVVAVWYPVLVVGVPLVAYGLGRRLPGPEAGALAAFGFGAGLVLDYAYLNVVVLPIPVAAHRAVVVAAVGLIAAGARSGSDAGARSVSDAGAQSGADVGARSEFCWTPALRAGAILWLLAVIAGHLV